MLENLTVRWKDSCFEVRSGVPKFKDILLFVKFIASLGGGHSVRR